MSGLAELLLKLGYRVSGSDLNSSDITRRLESFGGDIIEGHTPENVRGADVVVMSSAVKPDNPELIAAKDAGIPVISRAEMLAELMRTKYGIAIAGAHGKTSTTSIVAEILGKGNLDPTVAIGGKLTGIGSNAILGRGRYFVAEADESDGSLINLSPAVAVVTNIDLEHMDYYKDLEEIKDIFLSFVNQIPFYGLAVLCLDNEHVRELVPKIEKRFTTYAIDTRADFQAKKVAIEGFGSRFTLYHHTENLGEFRINLPGRHNVYNAMAGIAVGMELDVPVDTIRHALDTLGGVQRRLEIKGEVNEITVVDDYGHHPTEIKTTLQAAEVSWPGRRKVVVFQPHRYTRTRALFDDFTRAFDQTDILMVLPIYSAGEKEIEGTNSCLICDAIRSNGHGQVVNAESKDSAVSELKTILQPGDLLLTLGAGDVYQVGEQLLRELSE